MKMTLLFVACGALAGVQTAVAQDPVKLSPNLYKVLLENEHVRVLEFRVKPGDKEPMHSHPASVVYVLTDGKAKAITPDGKSEIIESTTGQTVWMDAATHAWEYLGPGEGRVLIIEMKGKVSASPATKRPQ